MKDFYCHFNISYFFPDSSNIFLSPDFLLSNLTVRRVSQRPRHRNSSPGAGASF